MPKMVILNPGFGAALRSVQRGPFVLACNLLYLFHVERDPPNRGFPLLEPDRPELPRGAQPAHVLRSDPHDLRELGGRVKLGCQLPTSSLRRSDPFGGMRFFEKEKSQLPFFFPVCD